jgi:hypothetical protein
VDCEPKHCASKDTLSELDFAHVCKCVLGRQQAAMWQQYYKRENGGRARESEEKIGQHGVSMKLDVKMRRVASLLREGERRDPACMYYKCHSQKSGLS